MEAYAIFDEYLYPIIKVSFTGNAGTDENFQAYLDQVQTCYINGGPVAMIFDTTKVGIPSLAHQKMQANWMKENEALIKANCLGTAYVISSSIIRGILNMIFSMQKQPVPYQIFKNEEEAQVWVVEILSMKDLKTFSN